MLLFRKHVITKQPYVCEFIDQMEAEGLLPVPIFINGVEAHTIVRDVLTSVKEEAATRETSYRPQDAASVDAIVNTIGFPLVGGPAGSMEAGRGVAEGLLGSMDVPYYVAAPLLLQDMASWRQSGVTGFQSVGSTRCQSSTAPSTPWCRVRSKATTLYSSKIRVTKLWRARFETNQL